VRPRVRLMPRRPPGWSELIEAWTDPEQAVLEEWLAGDSRCAGALARAQAAWVHTDRAQAFRGSLELRESPRARLWRRAMPWASAATVLLGLATAFLGLARKPLGPIQRP